MFPCTMTQYTKMTNKMQLCRIMYYSLAALRVLSYIFAHYQEHLNCITASGITHVSRCQLAATYVCNTRSCNTVQMLLMMNENIARNMQSSQGIINYPTQLHLVRHFRILLLENLTLLDNIPVWTGAENLDSTGTRSPDRPARSQSLYRLNYPTHQTIRECPLF